MASKDGLVAKSGKRVRQEWLAFRYISAHAELAHSGFNSEAYGPFSPVFAKTGDDPSENSCFRCMKVGDKSECTLCGLLTRQA